MAYCQTKKTVKRLGTKERLKLKNDHLISKLESEARTKLALQFKLDVSQKDAREWKK